MCRVVEPIPVVSAAMYALESKSSELKTWKVGVTITLAICKENIFRLSLSIGPTWICIGPTKH